MKSHVLEAGWWITLFCLYLFLTAYLSYRGLFGNLGYERLGEFWTSNGVIVVYWSALLNILLMLAFHCGISAFLATATLALGERLYRKTRNMATKEAAKA